MMVIVVFKRNEGVPKTAKVSVLRFKERCTLFRSCFAEELNWIPAHNEIRLSICIRMSTRVQHGRSHNRYDGLSWAAFILFSICCCEDGENSGREHQAGDPDWSISAHSYMTGRNLLWRVDINSSSMYNGL